MKCLWYRDNYDLIIICNMRWIFQKEGSTRQECFLLQLVLGALDECFLLQLVLDTLDYICVTFQITRIVRLLITVLVLIY